VCRAHAAVARRGFSQSRRAATGHGGRPQGAGSGGAPVGRRATASPPLCGCGQLGKRPEATVSTEQHSSQVSRGHRYMQGFQFHSETKFLVSELRLVK